MIIKNTLINHKNIFRIHCPKNTFDEFLYGFLLLIIPGHNQSQILNLYISESKNGGSWCCSVECKAATWNTDYLADLFSGCSTSDTAPC